MIGMSFRNCRCQLSVEAYNLLLARHNAGLGYGRPITCRDEPFGRDSILSQHGAEMAGVLILPDDPDEHRASTEACNVRGYVCRAPRHMIPAVHIHNRH